MRPIDAAAGHRAQEQARWWRLRLPVRPGGGYGRGWVALRPGATADTVPDDCGPLSRPSWIMRRASAAGPSAMPSDSPPVRPPERRCAQPSAGAPTQHDAVPEAPPAPGKFCVRVTCESHRPSRKDREGRRDRQIVRMRPERAELEAQGQVRTFVGGPSAAQWAMAGGAPAPQLNDRSRPRPQGGNGRERLPPPSACDRYTCWRRPYELEGDLGDESSTT
jgi:hypothetical protein